MFAIIRGIVAVVRTLVERLQDMPAGTHNFPSTSSPRPSAARVPFVKAIVWINCHRTAVFSRIIRRSATIEVRAANANDIIVPSLVTFQAARDFGTTGCRVGVRVTLTVW